MFISAMIIPISTLNISDFSVFVVIFGVVKFSSQLTISVVGGLNLHYDSCLRVARDITSIVFFLGFWWSHNA